MSSWADLPLDIGNLILDRLPELLEHKRFSAVCKRWCFISDDYNRVTRPMCKTLPMLVVPPRKPQQIEASLYTLSGARSKMYQDLKLPVPYGTRFCGSSHGWLAVLNKDYSMRLLYPFNGKGWVIHLPVLGLIPFSRYEYSVKTVVVSLDSTPDNYTVVAIHGGDQEMATIKSGEKSWSRIKIIERSYRCSLYSDAIIYKGLLYATTSTNMVVAVDIDARPPQIKTILPTPDEPVTYIQTYLVESTSSDLLLVNRHVGSTCDDLGCHQYPTKGFSVYKLKLHEVTGEVVERIKLRSLNDDALFVGCSMSTSVSAKKFYGCQPNSIYFEDDSYEFDYYDGSGPYDIGVYDVESGKIGHHYQLDPQDKDLPPAMWIVPQYH